MNIHGITLADFPIEIDRSVYPYLLILRSEDEEKGVTQYVASLSSKPIYYNPTTGLCGYDVPCETAMCLTYEGLDTWATLGGGTVTEPNETAFDFASVFWINFDVHNKGTDEIYLKAYNNIPLPPLPNDIDRSVYPYTYILKTEIVPYNHLMYLFVFLDKPMMYDEVQGNYIPVTAKMVGGSYTLSVDTGWSGVQEGVVEEDMYFTPSADTQITLIWSEVSEEKLYPIKESTLKNIGNSIRGKTGKTELIPPENMPSEIDGISSGGIENGYNVMFYDENNEELAFYSIKQGHSIEAPIYTCKAWKTEDGGSVSFPYTPIGDLVVYANNDSYASTLYGFYNIDPVTYPYLLIEVLNSNLYIYFAKTILRALAHYLEFQTGYKGYVSVSHGLTDFSDIASVVSAITQHIPTLTYQSSNFAAGSGENKYEYSNFDTNRTDPVPLGSYHLDE